jgi:glycosyltransferase involved in cell wall biosynthesis
MSRVPDRSDTAVEQHPIRMCVLTTIGPSIQTHYRGRLEYFNAHGFDVTVVCASSELDDEIRARGVRLHTAPLTRVIAPWQDLRALWNLWRFFRRERFDLIEVGTPKAALIGSIAARLAGAPCVIHLLHGLACQGLDGVLGWLARVSAAIPCRLAHETISVSPSAREDAHRIGICARGRMRVLGRGTCNGVDVRRFSPTQRQLGGTVRGRWRIPPDAVVLGFIGRLTRDKGLVELAGALREMQEVVLLLVGSYDERDRPPDEVIEFLSSDPRVRQVGFQTDVVAFLAAMDILVLPSYREGFPAVLLEAAAMGLPVVATNATGCRDAVEPDVTGLQVPVGDTAQLRSALERLVNDAELRRTMGAAGRRRVAEHFDQQRVWALYVEEYRRLAGRPSSARVVS